MVANANAGAPPGAAAPKTSTEGAATLTPDLALIGTLIALCLFGTVLTFSASYAVGIRFNDDGLFYLRRSLLSLGVGLAALLLTARVDYHFWRRFSVPAMAITCLALVVVLIVGESIGGARRWFDLGPIQMQPAEVMKFVLTLYMADLLDRKGSRIRHFMNGAVPFALTLSVIAFLVMLEPDLGTTTVLVMIGMSIFLVAGADLRQFALFVATGVVAFVMLAFSADYRRERLLSFLRPDQQDLRDSGWQLWQAHIALGNGGIFGQGLGASRQKFSWLPAAHTDAIIAVVGEELGLIGCVLVLALFTLLAVRGYRCALRAPDRFGAIMATGITTWICFQAMINIGGVTAAIPFTGVPLPFFSYGGSNLAVALGTLGVLINISRQGVPYTRGRGVSAPASRPLPHSRPTPTPKPTPTPAAAPDPDNDDPPTTRNDAQSRPLFGRPVAKARPPQRAARPEPPAPPDYDERDHGDDGNDGNSADEEPDEEPMAEAVPPRSSPRRESSGEFVTRIPLPRSSRAGWDDDDDNDGDNDDAGNDNGPYRAAPPRPFPPAPRSRPGGRDGERPGTGAIVTRLDPAAVRDDDE